jgi:hypothetical protein
MKSPNMWNLPRPKHSLSDLEKKVFKPHLLIDNLDKINYPMI